MAGSRLSASARAFKGGVAASHVFPALLHSAHASQAASSPETARPDVAASNTRVAAHPRAADSRKAHLAALHSSAWSIAGITPDDLVAILAALDEVGGTLEIGDLACAIPDCTRPISAILALVDAGYLAIDCAAAFDSAMRVTRIA